MSTGANSAWNKMELRGELGFAGTTKKCKAQRYFVQSRNRTTLTPFDKE